MQQQLQAKLQTAFQPSHLEIINESHRHAKRAANSHFHITLVSHAFEGQSLLARHRAVNKVLAEELAGEIHAITLNTLTPEEWLAREGQVTASPKCHGGS